MRKVQQFLVLGAIATGLTGVVGVHVAPAAVNAVSVDATSTNALSALSRLTWPSLGRMLAEDGYGEALPSGYVDTWAKLSDCTTYRDRTHRPDAWDLSLSTTKENFGAFEEQRRFTMPVQATMGAYDPTTGRLALTAVTRPDDTEFRTRAVVKGAPGMWCPDVTIEAFREKQDSGLPRRFVLEFSPLATDLSIALSARDAQTLRRTHSDDLLPATLVVSIDHVPAPDFSGVSRVAARVHAIHVFADAPRSQRIAVLGSEER